MAAKAGSVAALLLTALLAGCAGGSTGAQDAAAGADNSAENWADDAILAYAFSVEGNEAIDAAELAEARADLKNRTADAKTAEEKCEVAEDAAGIEAYGAMMGQADPSLLDGITGGWLFIYFSPSKSAVHHVVVSGSGSILEATECDVPAKYADEVKEAAADFGTARESWAVDASDAAAAVRAENITGLDAALRLNGTVVAYSLDLEDGVWHINAQSEEAFILSAEVDIKTGTLESLEANDDLLEGLPTDPNAPVTVPAPKPRVIPPPIDDSQLVPASLDPLNFAGMGICSAPTATCFEYPFTAENSLDVVGSLTWTVPADDFDLYIVDDGGVAVLQSANGLPNSVGTSESLSGSIDEGDYTVIVVAWATAAETFELHVEFA